MGRWDVEDVEPNWEIYRRELAERRHIVESCPIDIYASSVNPRWGYPHKLMSYWEARESVAQSAEEIFVDSGYRRIGEMTEVLEACEKVDADWFIPPDVTPHFDEYEEITPAERAENVWQHGREWERSDIDAKMLIPLHRPVDEHLEALQNYRPDSTSQPVDLIEKHAGVAVGLKKLNVEERVRILGLINRRTGPGTHVHGLSPGTEMEMLAYLRENPHMVDSLDVSTPESAPANNKVPDHEWHQHVVPFPRGDDVSTLRASRTVGIALSLNYMLSDLCDDSEFADIRDLKEAHQTGQITWQTFTEEVMNE